MLQPPQTQPTAPVADEIEQRLPPSTMARIVLTEWHLVQRHHYPAALRFVFWAADRLYRYKNRWYIAVVSCDCGHDIRWCVWERGHSELPLMQTGRASFAHDAQQDAYWYIESISHGEQTQ